MELLFRNALFLQPVSGNILHGTPHWAGTPGTAPHPGRGRPSRAAALREAPSRRHAGARTTALPTPPHTAGPSPRRAVCRRVATAGIHTAAQLPSFDTAAAQVKNDRHSKEARFQEGPGGSVRLHHLPLVAPNSQDGLTTSHREGQWDPRPMSSVFGQRSHTGPEYHRKAQILLRHAHHTKPTLGHSGRPAAIPYPEELKDPCGVSTET